jgi:hypothetical protein
MTDSKRRGSRSSVPLLPAPEARTARRIAAAPAVRDVAGELLDRFMPDQAGFRGFLNLGDYDPEKDGNDWLGDAAQQFLARLFVIAVTDGASCIYPGEEDPGEEDSDDSARALWWSVGRK